MDWLEYGYWGLFLAAFLSGTIIPLSSEAVLVGLLIAGIDPVSALIVATIGNWIGGMTTFWIGQMGKLDWIEKYFRVSHEKLVRWEKEVSQYGAFFAVLGWIPIFGNVIVLSLGFFHARSIPSAWWLLVGKTARYVVIIWVMY